MSDHEGARHPRNPGQIIVALKTGRSDVPGPRRLCGRCRAGITEQRNKTMPPPLRLTLTDYLDATRWRWVLSDSRGNFLADHVVQLDPTTREYSGFLDLSTYLDYHKPIYPPEKQLADLGTWIGEKVFGGLREALWKRRALPAVAVQVVVPEACAGPALPALRAGPLRQWHELPRGGGALRLRARGDGRRGGSQGAGGEGAAHPGGLQPAGAAPTRSTSAASATVCSAWSAT